VHAEIGCARDGGRRGVVAVLDDAAGSPGLLANDGEHAPPDMADAALTPSRAEILAAVADAVDGVAPGGTATSTTATVAGETGCELGFVEADVEMGVELLDHPSKGRMHKAFGVVDPAQVAVVPGEVDLMRPGATHQGCAIGSSRFVQGEAVKREPDIGGNVGDDILRLFPPQPENGKWLRQSGMRKSQGAYGVEAAQRVDLHIRPTSTVRLEVSAVLQEEGNGKPE